MIFLQLTYNLSLLIALSVLISFVVQKRKLSKNQKDIIFGLLFGFVAMTGMLFPVNFAPGVIFDGRTVVISLCALFFGPVSVTIAAAGAFILRASQGGVGVIPGVLNIITPAVIGLIFNYMIIRKNKFVRIRELLIMGLIVHIAMLLLMFLLPSNIVMKVIQSIGLPVISIYPLATILIGKIISDNLERNKFILNLKESEEKYRLLIENSNDIIYTLSKDGIFTFVSPAWTLLLGHPVKDVLNRSFQPFVHPDDLPTCLTFLQKMFTDESSENIIDYRVFHLNGTIHWHSTRAVALRDSECKITGFLGIARDITDLKRTQNDINESEKKFRSLYDNSPLPFQSLNENGIFLDVNPAWLRNLGYKKEEVVGESFDNFIDPESLKIFQKCFPEFIKNGSVSNVKLKMKKYDGKYIDVSYDGLIGRDNRNKIQTYCVFKDITGIEKAESNLALKVRELEDINRTMIGRELKMIELKEEINSLLKELGRTEKYDI